MSDEGEQVVELLTQIRDLLAQSLPDQQPPSASSPADDGSHTHIVRGD